MRPASPALTFRRRTEAGVSPTPRTTHPVRPRRAARITRLERRDHSPEGHQSANAGGGWRAGCRMDPGGQPGPLGIPSTPGAQGPKAHADVRISNMSLILRLLQKSPTLSRTRLARETGLSKATVSTLVAERCSRGLLIEEKPNLYGNVGRPSNTVRYSSTLGWHDVTVAERVRDAITRRVGTGRDVPTITTMPSSPHWPPTNAMRRTRYATCSTCRAGRGPPGHHRRHRRRHRGRVLRGA